MYKFIVIIFAGIVLQGCIPYHPNRFTVKSKKTETKLMALQPLRYMGDPEFAYTSYNVVFNPTASKNSTAPRILFNLDPLSKAEVYSEIRKLTNETDQLENSISLNSYPKDVYFRNDQYVMKIVKENLNRYKIQNPQTMDIQVVRIPEDTSNIPMYNPVIYIKDINNIFEKSMVNIMEKDTDYKGYITYRLTGFEKKGQYAWFATSLLTLFTLNFTGFPLMQRKVGLCLEIEIINDNGKLIKKYNSCAKKSAFSAMYWGYSMAAAAATESQVSTLQRAANAKTFSTALSEILIQLTKDISEINEQLK